MLLQGAYFTSTVLAALFSGCLQSQTFQVTNFTCGVIFLLLTFINLQRRKETTLIQCSDDDFPLMTISFRGIRTSLAFFELAMMAGVVVLNISCLLSAVDLKKHLKLSNQTHSSFVLLLTKNAPDFNYATVGLLLGFVFISFISLIKFKTIYLSYLAKLILVVHNLNFVFRSKSSQ